MKKLLLIIMLALMGNELMSQTFFVYDIETTAFPVIKAKFYAVDSAGNRILNLSPSDFIVTENGLPRKVLSVSCPSPQPPQALSAVLVIDASGSMMGKNMLMAKAGAISWVEAMPSGKSECAVTAFHDRNYIVQDFTSDKTRLENRIITITPGGGTNYNAALLDTPAGGLPTAKAGKYKKIVVMLTDGCPNREPKTAEIIDDAKNNDISVYGVTFGYLIPPSLKTITSQTGGSMFTNVTTEEQAKEAYKKIMRVAESNDPCTIEWESGTICKSQMVNLELSLPANGMKATESYLHPDNSIARLEFRPSNVRFLRAVKDTCVTVNVTARNADFNVTNITASNPAYRIEPPLNFSLKDGESRDITVCYTPPDSGYTYCLFSFESDICPGTLYASGGFPGIKPTVKTLKLIRPNGGEVFLVGTDTVITWEGVLPDDPVIIEYSTDNGAKWKLIAGKASGLSYNWHVPNTPSNSCLARVTAKSQWQEDCPEVSICAQVWMGCNLNVDVYRNGDTIRHAASDEEWKDAYNKNEGAWCYYNHDPANGEIYGKLYNAFAVSDRRGLAPEGWHIPTSEEWLELCNCLGVDAGGKLKSTGTIEGGDGLWYAPNSGATNESSFSALPGGGYSSGFWGIGKYGYWWRNSTYSSGYEEGLLLNYNNTSSYHFFSFILNSGYSVRCVRD